MVTFWRFVTCFSLLCWLGQTAQASSMPAADKPMSALHLGSGPALSLSFSPDPRWEFGLSAALPFYYFQDFGTTRYGAYGLVQLLNQNGFYMGLVAGVYGDAYFPDLNRYSPIGLQMGAALAYKLNQQLVLRLNLVPGVSLRIPPNGWVVFPPAGGAEIGWRWSDNLEATLGYNGNGDILGLNWSF